jgi:hypothetical protein
MRNGQALVYVYARETHAEADMAKVLTFDEARRIAVYVAKLPELLQSADARSRILCETGNGTYITGRNLDWNDTTAKNRPLGVPNEHPLVRLGRCPASEPSAWSPMSSQLVAGPVPPISTPMWALIRSSSTSVVSTD